MTDWTGALHRAHTHAPFLMRALDRLPDLEALLRDGRIDEALDAAAQAGNGEDDVGVALRRERLALSTAALQEIGRAHV